MGILSQQSLLSVPLLIKASNGASIANATGFFWKKPDGKTYLISNYHVFSGHHYKTGVSSHQNSALPGKIEYPRFVSKLKLHERSTHEVQLCDQAGNDQTWFQHPAHNRFPLDVAAVQVPTVANDNSFVYAVNERPEYECDLPLPYYYPGFEMLVVGFFLNDRPTGHFPVSVRAFVASEMDALYHGKPAFLIDAQTSAGMSGSPVFATGLDQHDRSELWSEYKTIPPFVGVYSGRIIEDDGLRKRELQVGLVWRREAVKQLIDSLP